MMEDIRWKQRFNNFQKALKQLKSGIEENGNNPIDIIKEGIIQRFEFTHELAWKVMKDFLEFEGITEMIGSRSTTKIAFNKGLIQNGQIWIDMIESRNITVHAYDAKILNEEYFKITTIYLQQFIDFEHKMTHILSKS